MEQVVQNRQNRKGRVGQVERDRQIRKDIYLYICCRFNICTRKTEAQTIFLNLFTVCSSCKRFVVCQFVYEELTENGKFRLFLCLLQTEKGKRQTSVCFLQRETENGSCFPWSANDKR
jgi:hypothetical protein